MTHGPTYVTPSISNIPSQVLTYLSLMVKWKTSINSLKPPSENCVKMTQRVGTKSWIK